MVDRTSQNVKVFDKKTLYKKFFRVDEYSIAYPRYDGTLSKTVSREVMERGNAVGVLLYDPDADKIVLVEQFRVGAYAAGNYPWILECAAGIIDDGETPEQSVVREAAEETGLTVNALEFVTEYFSSPGGLTEKIYIYCAKVDSRQEREFGGLPSEGEDIRILDFPASDVEKLLAERKADNALTIIALQWFVLNRNYLRQKWGKS